MERMVASLAEVVEGHAGRGGDERSGSSVVAWASSLGAISMDVAKGMSYLHSRNVLHRDLKPANILLNEHWVAKVADFGTALAARRSHLRGADVEPSAPVHPAGTLAYMAPEMMRLDDARSGDKAIDVWSFGCVLAHIAAGKAPSQMPCSACTRRQMAAPPARRTRR